VTTTCVTAGAQTTNPAGDGTYSLELDAGTYDVTFTLDGYADSTVTGVEVVEGQFATVNATLVYDNSVQNNTQDMVAFSACPNPFNPETTLVFSLSQPSAARLDVFNIRGQKVATLVDESLTAGVHRVVWRADGFASGVYLARLNTSDGTKLERLVLLK